MIYKMEDMYICMYVPAMSVADTDDDDRDDDYHQGF